MRRLRLFFSAISLTFVLLFIVPPVAHAQDVANLFFGGLLGPIISSLLGLNASTDKNAVCSSTLGNLSGNPIKLDEQRNIGGNSDCALPPLKYFDINFSVTGTTTVPFPNLPPTVSVDVDPAEFFSDGNIDGFRFSSTTQGVVEDKDDLSGYFDCSSYTWCVEQRRLWLRDKDPTDPEFELSFLNSSGALERLDPLNCRDEVTGEWLRCPLVHRWRVLRAAARGYVYSERIAEQFGLNPADRHLFEFGDDPLLGWLHAKCMVDKSCALQPGVYLPTAWSTDRLGVEGELPYYGIVLFCQKGMTVGDISDDTIHRMCELVVGPNYRAGQVAPEGLLWQEIAKDGLHPLAYTMQSCGMECEWASSELSAASLEKVGVNFAIEGENSDYEHLSRLGLKFSVDLVRKNDAAEQGSLASRLKSAKGITPIIRICVKSQTCPFAKASDYGAFLEEVYKRAGQQSFYAIAGPNEANSETWLGNKEGDAVGAGSRSGAYGQELVADLQKRGILATGTSTNGIKLLSPAFNTDYSGFAAEAAAWKTAIGSAYASISGIAANAYNKGARISSYVEKVKTAFPDKDIYLTEVGMYESSENPSGNGVPRAQALINLAAEIGKLATDDKVIAVNIFNAFGKNTDPAFKYNVISDAEFAQLAGGAPIIPSEPGSAPPIIYTSTPIGVEMNIPTGIPKELGVEVNEVTDLKAGQDLDSEVTLSPLDVFLGRDTGYGQRKVWMTYPAGIQLATNLAQKIGQYSQAFPQVETCKNSFHDFDMNYDGLSGLPAYIEDAITTGELVVGRTYTLVDNIGDLQNQIPVYDPRNPISEIPITLSRTTIAHVAVPALIEQMLRAISDQKCGFMWPFAQPVVEKMNEPLEQFNSMKFVDWPGGDNNIACSANSTCGQQDFLPGPFGGPNGISNPNLGVTSDGQKIIGLLPSNLLEYNPSRQVSASRILHNLAKTNENLANQPWKELSSFTTQQNLVKDNPILSLQ